MEAYKNSLTRAKRRKFLSDARKITLSVCILQQFEKLLLQAVSEGYELSKDPLFHCLVLAR